MRIVSLSIFCVMIFSCSRQTIIYPQRKDIRETVYASGKIISPSIIMADEPIGNLDSTNSGIVFNILQDLSRNKSKSFITVTYDTDFAKRADRIIEIADGKIVYK